MAIHVIDMMTMFIVLMVIVVPVVMRMAVREGMCCVPIVDAMNVRKIPSLVAVIEH